MLKKEKKIVFETIKPQKVRYISKHSFGTSVLHTRYRLLQPVLLLVVVVGFFVCCFRIFSVCVRERDLWHMTHSQVSSEVRLRCWKIKHYTKINFCCRVHLVSKLFRKCVPKRCFGSLKWLYRHFLNQHLCISDVIDDANKGYFSRCLLLVQLIRIYIYVYWSCNRPDITTLADWA